MDIDGFESISRAMIHGKRLTNANDHLFQPMICNGRLNGKHIPWKNIDR